MIAQKVIPNNNNRKKNILPTMAKNTGSKTPI